jgi:hypothetical protein
LRRRLGQDGQPRRVFPPGGGALASTSTGSRLGDRIERSSGIPLRRPASGGAQHDSSSAGSIRHVVQNDFARCNHRRRGFFRAVSIVNNAVVAPFALYTLLALVYFVCSWLLTAVIRRLDPKYVLSE